MCMYEENLNKNIFSLQCMCVMLENEEDKIKPSGNILTRNYLNKTHIFFVLFFFLLLLTTKQLSTLQKYMFFSLKIYAIYLCIYIAQSKTKCIKDEHAYVCM